MEEEPEKSTASIANLLTNSRLWFFLAIILLVAGLIHLLAPILTPFMAGALLAYLIDPAVDFIQKRKISRTAAVIIVFLLVFGLLAIIVMLLIPLLQSQFIHLMQEIPQYLQWLDTHVRPWLGKYIPAEILPKLKDIGEIAQQFVPKSGGFIARIFQTITRSGAVLFGWIANLLLIPVITFYFLRDWDTLIDRVYAVLPVSIKPTAARLSREADAILSAFLRGQMLVMLALGVIYSIGLWFIGLKYGLLIGVLAGVVSFIPYMGTFVGVIVAGLAMLFQTQNWVDLWQVGAVFGFGQLLEGYALTPWLVGDRIGLHPVAVIFAVLAGGQLFGFVGVLLGLPAAAVLAVFLRYLYSLYEGSSLYG